MMKPLYIFLGLLIFGRLLAAAPDDEEAVRALISQYAQGREGRSPEALARLFTPDADQLVSSGEWRFGKDQLISGMMGSSARNPGERTITVERVRLVTPDAAIADARYVIQGQNGSDRNMWSTFFAVRTPEGWRLTGIRNMLPALSR